MTVRPAQLRDFWQRALQALAAAERDTSDGYADSAASRAYYAAFHAVSALLLSAGKRFSKHSGVMAALHKDCVKGGLLPKEAGRIYVWLAYQRDIGDYGGSRHVAAADAQRAVADARRFLAMVRPLLPAEPADSPPL